MSATSRPLDPSRPRRVTHRRFKPVGLAGITAMAAGSLVATLFAPPFQTAAAATREKVPPIELTRSIPVGAVPAGKPAPAVTSTAPVPAPTWPAATSGQLDLGTLTPATGKPGLRTVGATGVSVSWGSAQATTSTRSVGAGSVQVRTLARSEVQKLRGAVAAYEVQLPATLSGKASAARLTFDTSGVASAAGGDYRTRLRAVLVSGCLTPAGASGTSPAVGAATCRVSDPVPGQDVTASGITVDTASLTAQSTTLTPGTSAGSTAGSTSTTKGASTVTGAATSGPMMVALVSGSSGTNGAFSATPLAPASEWSAGGSSGSMNWSYPVRVPPTPGGLDPNLALSYSSGSVDGRTASTNNQPSWVGEGFDLQPGYIERRYVPCADDMGSGANNTAKTGDLCFRTDSTKTNDATWDNATLSVGGSSDPLVRVGNTTMWRKLNDDGTRIQKQTTGCLSGVSTECWVVTTTDGTKYYYGLGKANASAAATNSVWTVPVFGNHAGEPGYVAGSFATSSASRAWRWNLDLVVTPTGDSMVYTYKTETNYYQKNLTAAASYVRAGYLEKIEYGQRAGTEQSTPAPAYVQFTVGERCYTDTALNPCETATMTSANAYHWPDVPFDQICTSATTCSSTTQSAPTFFSRKRLATVQTYARNAANTGYDAVDQWTLTHTYPDPGDATSRGLWLSSVKQTGMAGTATDLPTTTFSGQAMDNRVDGVDNAPPLRRYRLWRVVDGFGQDLSWAYTPTECTPTTLPTAETNGKRCFPAWYTAPGQSAPTINWFHKYLVDSVTTNDTATGSPAVFTDYTYNGTPAWHYDESELTVPKYRTWGSYRGYGSVTTTVGAAATKSTTIDTFFRGMNGDRATPTGGTKTVTVTDSTGAVVTDQAQLAGALRETRAMDGAVMKSSSIYDQWISPATATDGSRTATLSDVAETRTKTALAAGGTRDTRTVNTYDPTYGDLTQVDDLGDVATSADDTCTVTTYTRNTTAWILSTVATAKTTSDACAAGVTAANTTASEEFYYDGATALTTAPTQGLPTWTRHLAGSPGAGVMRDTAKTEYADVHGRPTKVTDANGNATLTSYSDAGGLNRSVTATSPDPDGAGPLTAHASTATVDARWGVPTKQVDANGRTTEVALDALGRTTSVWLPGRAKATQSANQTFSYLLRSTGPNAVTTNTLLPAGTYRTTIALFDGLRRPRQNQTQTLDEQAVAGTVFTETHYDSRGLAIRSAEPYFSKVAISTTMQTALDINLPGQTLTDYDALARPTLARFFTGNGTTSAEKWRTTTSYGGDRTTITPPPGQAPVTTIEDALGRTTRRIEYQSAAPTGPSYDTTYSYDTTDQLTAVTDTAGNQWSYTYDLDGLVTASVDPDTGTSSSTYDPVGNLTRTINGAGQALRYTYDALGRKTSTTDDAGTVRASWEWDTLTGGKGILAASNRVLTGGAKLTQRVTALDPAGHPTTVATIVPSVPGLIEAGLAKTYTSTTSYTIDGQTNTVGLPAIANLGAETLTYGYDTLGRAKTLTNGATTPESYLTAAYTAYDQPRQDLHGTLAGKKVYNNYTYEAGTQRLIQTRLIRAADGVLDQTRDYTWSPAGDITKINTARDATTGVATDTQCLTYDLRRQVTNAWTPSSGDCAPAATAAGLGGPAPYWAQYGYDSIGNRQAETLTTPTGATSTSQYTYPAAGATAVRPHYATSVTTSNTGTGAPTPAGTRSFTANGAGKTTARTASTGAAQTLTWDPEGTLADISVGAASVSKNVYDADGNRVLRRDATTSTLYVGGDEITITHTTGALAAKRHYSLGGRTIALRTGPTVNDITSLVADRNGTGERTLNNGTGAISTNRYRMPFGATRGPVLAWPDSRGYVGGVDDPSTLTHLGAREYDPTTGTFISADPLLDISDPIQMNAYAYANNNPITMSDPSGLLRLDDDGRASKDRFSNNQPTYKPKKSSYVPSKAPRPYRSEAEEDSRGSQRSRSALSIQRQKDANAKLEAAQLAAKRASFLKYTIPGAGTFDHRDDTLAGADTGGQAARAMWDFAFAVTLDDFVECGRGDGAACTWAAIGFIPIAGKGAKGVKVGVEAAEAIGQTGVRAANTLAKACSFTGSTVVLMADGTHKPIDQVRVGDKVLATDPETGEQAAKEVTHVFAHGDTVSDLVIDGKVLSTTEDHPFWSVTDQRFERADELAAGEQVLSADGRVLTVGGFVLSASRVAIAYNLSVEGIHTYHVGSGELLVHNSCDLNGLAHAAERHLPGGAKNTHASTFWDGTSMDSLASLANTTGRTGLRQANGNYQYVMRAPQTIGVDAQTGLATDIYTVIRRPAGDLVTMFPGTTTAKLG